MKGILLNNLGSPDSTDTKDVKKYLGEFLMDERVIDIPFWKRWILIKGIILKIRPKKIRDCLQENLVERRFTSSRNFRKVCKESKG